MSLSAKAVQNLSGICMQSLETVSQGPIDLAGCCRGAGPTDDKKGGY
jgi:hypothetical protein